MPARELPDIFGEITNEVHRSLLASVRCPDCEHDPQSVCHECQRWRLLLAVAIRADVKADELPREVFAVVWPAAMRSAGDG